MSFNLADYTMFCAPKECCSHETEPFFQYDNYKVWDRIANNDKECCPICSNMLKTVKLIPCNHEVCFSCYNIIMKRRNTCPMCSEKIATHDKGSLFHKATLKKIINTTKTHDRRSYSERKKQE